MLGYFEENFLSIVDCASEGAGNATKCELDMKQCKSGQCIPDWWWCDNTRDCVDNSDEESCDAFSCPIDYVKCNNVSYMLTLLFMFTNSFCILIALYHVFGLVSDFSILNVR